MLAEPRDPGLGALGARRRASPGCRARAPAGRRRRCGASRRACGGRRRAGRATTSLVGEARARRRCRRRRARSQASTFVRAAAHASMAGRMSDSRWSIQPCRVAKRSSSTHSGWPTSSASVANWCSRPTCTMNQPSAARKPCMISGPSSPPRSPIDQKLVTMSVMATIASSMATSTCWPAGASRWRSAASTPMTREQRGADVAERADRATTRRVVALALELVDARHRLDDRGERRPVAVRASRRVAEAGDRQVDAGGVHGRDVVVAEAEAVIGAGLEVLGDDVEPRRQRAARGRGPRGALRSTQIERLPRLLRRNVAPTRRPSGSVIAGSDPRPDLAVDGCSTLTTSAPSRASSWVREGQRLHLLERQDPHAVERLAGAAAASLASLPST